jgi:molybdopterin-containing oxidoreductase family iron-sulfur binding subunit
VVSPPLNEKAAAVLAKVATELVGNKGAGLVVASSNNRDEQILINKINELIGSYGNTIDVTTPSYQRQGNEKDLDKLINDMAAGNADVLIVLDQANPAYDYPDAEKFKSAFQKVKTKISFVGSLNETAELCDVIAPKHHLLESWGDAEPKHGILSLVQPTIAPLFNTRQAELSLLKWAGSETVNWKSDSPYYEYLKAAWQQNFLGNATWDKALHDGVFSYAGSPSTPVSTTNINVTELKISQPSATGDEIDFYETINIGAGQHANNPWLQEMADPVTRCVWGNYLAVPVAFDGVNKFIGSYELENGDYVKLNVGKGSLESESIQQFGQMPGTLSIGLGYGRTVSGPVGKNLGTNAFAHCQIVNGLVQYYNVITSAPSKLSHNERIACVQYHHTMGVEDIDKRQVRKSMLMKRLQCFSLISVWLNKDFRGL